ncbi:MAG: ATP-dependent DNA helicase RecG, partial [Elusimicrobia bacterium]|nr:ATP-dependent DNA helicase RecG [Elusimicrobiota bacterium]
DMTSPKGMNRMLMGDVGSGKTVVALSAILLAVENGYQAAIVAPTEILAEQHYLTFKNMLEGLNVNIELVTSSALKAKKKREEILADIKNGKTNIIVGTHSVMEERVKFKNLSLVVIDEQHRFGVMQKAALLANGKFVDILMMTATPIPRGLAMTIYGEISISVIKELPPNRIPIKTFCFSEQQAYIEAKDEIDKGHQVFIVYPLIDESDKMELKSAVKEAETLATTVFKNNKLALLHGKMSPKEKNEIMQQFKNKEFDILVATTVIEVGIDIPNATMIIIQHADRYGLATLHQLRGRVGRGNKQSYCILVSSSRGKNSAQRLAIMTQTNDGFKIAEEDLKMRGPGEFTGTMQHGFPEFKAGNIIKDVEIIEQTKDIAQDIIEKDPTLSAPENIKIKQLINGSKYSELSKIIQVG